MKTDLQIAQECTMEHIEKIAKKAAVDSELLFTTWDDNSDQMYKILRKL